MTRIDAGNSGRVRNAMSVDVEDYFQVSAMEGAVSRSAWDGRDLRVERNVDRILALFADHGVVGTFFTLGWIAERFPAMVRRIVDGGHELASHGYEHKRVVSQTEDAFRSDVARTKAILEDVSGREVQGYRAASFSIGRQTPWAFDVLAGQGYRYSSSTYPIRHDLYGDPKGARDPFRPIAGAAFLEIPVATLEVGAWRLPCGGGGYFRLFPLAYSSWALGRLNRSEGRSAVFYFHPWEIDPGQPRVPGLSLRSRVRHYTNLDRMERKLAAVLRRYCWGRIDDIFMGAQCLECAS